ncbi:MAG: nucleotidyl transferase AbiEii/AbiGii toxin family protein [Candidatus Aegiribacteria sp.]|nr:nucleotidyl transferase AbiEii/AbiGii toxin family protein [Candidatus Aegiribacteria sp.]
MGGTALRIFYGSSRFSEDLDFDSKNLSNNDLQGIAMTVVNEFELEAVECNVTFSKGSAFSAKFRFTDVLQKWELTRHNDEVLTLKYDASPQHYNYTPEVKVLNRLDVIVPVPSASAELILAQKLYAILNRNRIMGRDLYDASHLFGITEPDMNYLDQKVQVSSRKKIEVMILNRLDERSIDDLARDVEPFVPGRNDLLRVKLFPEVLRSWAGTEQGS